MTPDFQITADGTDATGAVRKRLISLSLGDADGLDSDDLELVLDDRAGEIELPRTGAELEVRLGYRQSGLALMGVYVVDEINLSDPPLTMTLRARAADLRQRLKKPRTRDWDDVTIGDIVAAIAQEHGYAAKVSDDLKAEVIAHIDQVDESDLHFLTRLAKERGAVAKPAGKMLLFVPKGQAKSATGKDLPLVGLKHTQLSSFDVTIAERGKYPAVKARWHDADAAEEQSVTAGDGEPVFTIGRRYPDRAAAESAAKARLDAFCRGAATLRLTCPGDTRLAAETRLTVSGCRAGVDGDWTVTRVTHRLDANGYGCDIEAESAKDNG